MSNSFLGVSAAKFTCSRPTRAI